MCGIPNSHSYIHGMKLQVTDIINSWTKDQFLQVMSDVYKDAHGVRPHGKNYHEWTIEELKEEFLRLIKI